MGKFSDLAPVVIGIIAFIFKIISDANKKKEQQPKPSPEVRTRGTYQSPASQKREYDLGQKPQQVNQRIDTYNWESSRTSDNEYRSLDPKYVPQDVPNVDYDKMDNVSVQPLPQISLGSIEKRDSQKLISVRNKLKQKDALKELYLLSEILNKPKAYRKWPRSIH